MTAASLLLAATLFAFALWLEQRERGEPKAGDGDATFDDDYLAARRKGRQIVFWLLVASAVLIAVAGLAGPGPVWVASWLAVCGLVMLVLSLALLDAYRTNRYIARKLPELRRQAFEQHFDGSECNDDGATENH